MKIHCPHDKLVPIDELKSHPKNRNKHPVEQVMRLASILEYQGWRYPVKVSLLSGCVTSGHGRIEAARLNGWKKVPVSYQPYDDEAQEYADVQADNSIASWAELDLAGINADIGDLGPDFDIDLLGIRDFTVDVSEKLGDPDAIPDVPKEAKTKRGELWQLDNHRVLCGDATSREDVERLMAGEKADMVFTDPPYNIAGESDNTGASVSPSRKLLKEAAWDQNFDITTLFPSLEAVLSADSTVYVCTSHYLAGKIWDWLYEWADTPSWCVWEKPNPFPSLRKRHWTWCGELICYGTRGKHAFNFPSEGHLPNIWRFNKNAANDLHPTQKPVTIPEHAILHSSAPSGLVADLFGGSGSTLIAAEQTGRRCFGMEIEPLYCDVILTRWAKFTGRDPVREDGMKWSELSNG